MPGPPLSSFLQEQAINIAVLPPTALAYMDPGDFPALQTLLVAGEACPPELVKRWAPSRRFVNAYGPTETTVMATFAVCKPDVGKPPIGRPLANFEAYVLNEARQPVPIGAPGELYIGGVGLARGYLGRPELTASRFVPSPFREGARLYRTGDRVRYLPDATLDFLGRVDDQVKLRGFRIELGEIEAVMATHPAVREAAVIVTGGEGGDRALAAFVVLAPDQQATSEALRAHVKERLPPHMVPSTVEALAALPLTPNAKVDRKALALLGKRATQQRAQVEPRTPTERVVAAVWAEVLRRESVGALDDFFELGGHSLSAVRAAMKLADRFHVAVPLRLLFEKPTVAALAEDLAARRGEASAARAEIGRAEGRGSWPLTFGQEQVWFVDSLQPGTHAYDHPSIHRLIGPIDEELLAASLAVIVARHGALRTTFAQIGGVPAQVVADSLELPIEHIDLRGLAAEARKAEALSVAREAARRAFDLASGPLIAVTLARVSAEERLLIINLHHIVSDAWSMALLHGELSALYGARLRGEAPALPELPIQYADFAVFQREEAAGLPMEEQLAWWRSELDGAPLHLDLPTDKRRPAAPSFRGATERLTLDAALAEPLRALARRLGVTPFVVLLAGFALLLHRHARQDDLLLGIPTSGRARKECEHLIGMFTNVLVLRSKLASSRTFAELARALGDTLLAAHEHGEVPFERLVEALHPARDLAENPVVQVAIVPQDIPFEGLALEGARVEELELDRDVAQFDFIVFTRDTGQEIAVWAEYATDLFVPATAAALLARWAVILEQAARDEGRALDDFTLRAPSDEARLAALRAEGEAPRPGAPFDLARGERVAHAFPGGSVEAEIALRAAAHAGAALVPLAPSDARPERLAAALRAARVSTLLAPPALAREAARRAPTAFAGLRQLLLAGGEPLDGDAALSLLEAGPPARFAQLHGLAGSPVVTAHEISGGEMGRAAPLGKPLAGSVALVLDERRRLAPPGLPGQLFVGGALLPPLDPSDAPAPEIVGDLGPGLPTVLLPTGVIARLRWDGEIELAGRPDPRRNHDDEPRPSSARDADAALRPVLQAVLRIFREILATPEIGPDDDFFEHGGHSLKAVQILARVERELGVRAGLRQFFQGPSAERLAAFVESTAGAAALRRRSRPPAAPARPGQLSFPQEDLLRFDAESPGAAYHIPLAVRLRGSLDEAALREALAHVARRHEPLRSHFFRGPEGPTQRVDDDSALLLPLDDLRHLPEPARLAEALVRAAALVHRSFDLAAAPLARALLLRLADDDHLLALSLHHLVADGWSIGVLLREIEQLYPPLARGAAPSLPPLPARYADFCAAQARFREPGAGAADLAFWREALDGVPRALALPADRPAPAQRSHAGDSEALLLDAATSEALKTLGSRAAATPFMTRLALFGLTLRDLTGQADLVIGSASSGRVDHDHEGLIGCFFNKVPLRLRLDPDLPFTACLERVREATLRAFEHDQLPFPLLAEALDPGARGRHPIFQVAYAAQEESWDALSLPGLRCEPVFLDRGMAPLDLTLYTREIGGALRVWLEYDRERFDAVTIQRLLATFASHARALTA
jgi:non-ribosomal peptide synthetase component F/acyl carrier protein